MTRPSVNICQCASCQQGEDHPDREFHQLINLLMSRLDEQQRRWYAGLEAHRIGHGGTRLVSRITGLSEKTVCRGRREILDLLADYPPGRVRRKGGGRSCGSSPAAQIPNP
jgi:hypothetical protein